MTKERSRLPLGLLLAIGAALALVVFLVQRSSSPVDRRADAGDPAAATPVGSAAAKSGRLAEAFRSPIALLGGQESDAAAADAALRGRVVSAADGNAVAGAEIVMLAGGTSIATKSDAQGRFELHIEREGNVTFVSASKSGFLTLEPGTTEGAIVWRARPGRAIDDVVLTLEPATTIVATVVDPSGKPATEATLVVTEPARHTVSKRANVDAKGEARFEASSGAIVRADHPRFASVYVAIDERVLLSRRLSLRFEGDATAKGSLRGRVLDHDGHPVAHAHVACEGSKAARHGSEVVEHVFTADDGRFAIDLPTGDRYSMNADAPGLAPASLADVVPGGPEIVLTLGASGRITGHVRDANGPLGSFTVMVWERFGDLRLVPRAEASFLSDGGEFVVEGLGAGTYAVSAVAMAHGASPRVETKLSEGGAASVDLELPKGARIFGRVIDAKTKKPIADARVSVEGILGPGGSAVSTARSKATGDFELNGVSAVLGSISVAAERYHGRVVSGLAPKEGGELGPLPVELRPLAENEEPTTDLVGIGAVLSLGGDLLVVKDVLAGSGAEAAGVRAGDVVVEVDGQNVKTLGFDGAVQAIRGVEGTTVTLTIDNDAGAHPVVVRRTRIQH